MTEMGIERASPTWPTAHTGSHMVFSFVNLVECCPGPRFFRSRPLFYIFAGRLRFRISGDRDLRKKILDFFIFPIKYTDFPYTMIGFFPIKFKDFS